MVSFCIFLVCFLIIIVYVYFKWSYGYWRRKGVPEADPIIPTGNLRVNFKTSETQFDFWRRIYRENKKKGYKHVGLYMFTSPQYVPLDPEIIRHIICEDFNYFVDRGLYYNERDNPMSAHIVALNGNRWRNARKKLTPIFTAKRIKMMFGIISECANQLDDFVAKRGGGPIDIKSAIDSFVINVTGSSAFGLECNAFEDDLSDVTLYVRKALSMSKFEYAKMNFGTYLPELARFLRVDFMSKSVTRFFRLLVKNTVSYRKNNNVSRDDFMQLLINLMDSNDFSMDDVAAQAFAFFIAGFETMTHAMAFTLYQLCLNLEVQNKLREEVCRVLSQNRDEISYDSLSEMKFMDDVIFEALRLYPPLPLLNRKCVKDYAVPNTNLVLKKGTFVVIPMVGLHYDAEYFPNPEKFDPSRFRDKSSIKPCTYLPFGDGPRNCIGQRFGFLMVKSVTAVLLKKYQFTLNSKTATPLKFRLTPITLMIDDGLWLNVKAIHKG